MSLNGLDNPDVQNAYQTAVADAGGWFLLKYTSRDAVELLGRGKNGVSEARNAIIGYTEASPLYGLLLYRRRKILIKYIPDGTSRLLQARTTVHFQDVLERYSPYETLLEITTADALNDTFLAASFQLHTASPSHSFSRLDEIQEDGEDGGASVGQNADASKSSASLASAQRNKTERRLEQLKKRTERAERASLSSSTESQATGESALPVERATSPLKTSMSQYLVREESGHTFITELESPFSAVSEEAGEESQAVEKEQEAQEPSAPQEQTAAPQQTASEPAKSAESAEAQSVLEDETSQAPEKELRKPSIDTVVPLERSATAGERSTKPSMEDDPYDLRKYDEWFKPKVKLGPRPVNTAEKAKRPAVARVSALPANFKPAIKKQEPARPKSSGQESVSTASAPRAPAPTAPTGFVPPPIPDTPEYKPRPISRGSVKSAPSHKSTMTPDKLRLMKAIELRKKQLRKSQEQQATKPPSDDAPEVPRISDARVSSPQETRSEEPQEQETETTTDDESHPQSTKADSGIEIRSDKHDSQDEDHRGAPIEQMPVLQEQGPPDASHALAGEHASPLDTDERSKVGEDIVETTSSEQQADELSSVESQTTERPSRRDHVKEESAAVPTIVMEDGSRPRTSNGAEHTEERDNESESHGDEDLSTNSENLHDAPTSPKQQDSDLAKRRRGFVEPLQVEVPSGNPDDFLSDDDDLLDELHDATFEEATPIMVARSPLTPGLPIARKASADGGSVRSVNIQRPATAGAERSVDDRPSPESAVPALSPTPPPEKYDPVTGLARNVSSGISKRIQALEAAGYSSMQSRPLTPETSPGGYQEAKERKASAKRPTSFRRHSSNRASQMPTSHPSASVVAPSWSIQHDPATNKNSVSVTARIVRPSVIDESESDVGPLQHSELIMNRQRESTATTPTTGEPPSLNTSRTQSVQSMESAHTLSPMSRNSGEFRTMHSASRFGRHRQASSPALDDFPPPPSSSRNQSQMSLASNDENVAPKEGGRTSRFFKRMSTIPFGASKRKSTAQSNSTTSLASSDGGNKPSQRISVTAEKDTPPAVVVGDLNVQFPDSLLWKRRIVTINDSGFLQFAIAQAMDIHKGVALKKFALTDFKPPYAPDPDSQELPYSVVMEFHDGTTLQAACEDAMTQRQVLHLLKTYWRAWAA
ncbi:hypothetical protein M409DRAFT_27537 [Zasmidium cellare ATCC 36951]|uniref:ADF-H domain-containing protein n=1 Tax=Zasmidium cellare ATCC 36951 TaxID=1080233 RepID=A0A6A6C4U1_ZASCE|nr:uncharacterized protein M409DRAFT_27537 [Zasmidium cellare ATCC 36951]KAF2162154.1 hypothetical protein M409DRAFT_27537 [Zasmidium cellare ATCC 36951]